LKLCELCGLGGEFSLFARTNNNFNNTVSPLHNWLKVWHG
jgi:hypothetical protein